MANGLWFGRTFSEKSCVGCGKPFTPTVGSQKRCTPDCSKERACIVCGASFIPHRHKKAQMTCSFMCAKKVQVFSAKSCKACGAEFQPAGSNHQYCSDVCELGDCTCRTCGKHFVPSKNSSGKFCSKVCWHVKYAPIGGTKLSPSGYVLIKVPPTGDRKRWWMLEHRAVMEKYLGRQLTLQETVHHKDGNKVNNKIENLELWAGPHGSGIRLSDHHCPGCRCDELKITSSKRKSK